MVDETVGTPRNSAPDVDHTYTPDEFIDLPSGLTFTRLLLLIVVVVVAVDYLVTGLPDGVIPYNYQFLVGIVYCLSAVVVLEKIYNRYDRARLELVSLSERTSDVVIVDEYEINGEQIDREFQSLLDKGFHPVVIVGGGVVGGAFVYGVMWGLDVFWAYPYHLTNYLYGAVHGLYYGPLAVGMYLIHRISNTYISDIDILAPDGLGGYRAMGDALVSIITYAIFLVTLDFIIISSISFLDNPIFRGVAMVIYAAMLGFFLLLTLYATIAIRRRLLDIQERKIDIMREYFNETETTFWRKQAEGINSEAEASEIMTMYTMFDHLNQMALWPLNLYSFAKLAISLGSSLFVFALDYGILSLPF
ncbi:hypothetical protein [Haloplanus aerogenes]|uniref:Uncharacterized protein n=1 Tax=Haloplanus aerogenes TaxID=660522 RepID=A0A3M0DQQ1_9EURY|nr:hypothetical protein [Haloplanus aerogenes]AZH24412.1 hypothetical protein DU502_03030 [Haloplanus aerogenes]RMB23947.1 hypothetical protein ATH50_1177 [Haloplanus aerogenes]